MAAASTAFKPLSKCEIKNKIHFDDDHYVDIQEGKTRDAAQQAFDLITDHWMEVIKNEGQVVKSFYFSKSSIDNNPTYREPFSIEEKETWGLTPLTQSAKSHREKGHFQDILIVVALCTAGNKEFCAIDVLQKLIIKFQVNAVYKKMLTNEKAHGGNAATRDHDASCIYMGLTLEGI